MYKIFDREDSDLLHILYGKKGTGKSRRLIAEANRNHVECGENSVFIDKDGDRMYELNRGIRFINASLIFVLTGRKCSRVLSAELRRRIMTCVQFISTALWRSLSIPPKGLFGMFDFLREFSEKTNIELYISISSENEAPDYLKAFINQWTRCRAADRGIKGWFFRRDAAHANFSVEIQLKIHYNIAGAAMPCLAGICPNWWKDNPITMKFAIDAFGGDQCSRSRDSRQHWRQCSSTMTSA